MSLPQYVYVLFYDAFECLSAGSVHPLEQVQCVARYHQPRAVLNCEGPCSFCMFVSAGNLDVLGNSLGQETPPASTQAQCGCYANFTSSPLVFDTYPTGNDCPGACLTSSAMSVQGTTDHDDKREYLVSLGLTSDRGAHSRPTPYHDKVTLYTGIVGKAGTGDIWSINREYQLASATPRFGRTCTIRH